MERELNNRRVQKVFKANILRANVSQHENSQIK